MKKAEVLKFYFCEMKKAEVLKFYFCEMKRFQTSNCTYCKKVKIYPCSGVIADLNVCKVNQLNIQCVYSIK